VVDRVELAQCHEVKCVVHFDGQPTVVGHQGPQCPGESEQIRHVGVDVVGCDQIGRSVFVADRLGQRLIQEARQVGTPRSRAASPTLTDGSMPRHGMPRSTTRDVSSRPSLSTAVAT